MLPRNFDNSDDLPDLEDFDLPDFEDLAPAPPKPVRRSEQARPVRSARPESPASRVPREPEQPRKARQTPNNEEHDEPPAPRRKATKYDVPKPVTRRLEIEDPDAYINSEYTVELQEEWEVERARNGVEFLKLPKTRLDSSGNPILVAPIDLDDMAASADLFLAHLRVAPTKEEIETLRRERAERMKKQKAEYDKVVAEQEAREEKELAKFAEQEARFENMRKRKQQKGK